MLFDVLAANLMPECGELFDVSFNQIKISILMMKKLQKIRIIDF